MTSLLILAPILVGIISAALYQIGVNRGLRIAMRRRSYASRGAVRRVRAKLIADHRESEEERDQAVGEFCQAVYDAADHATEGCLGCRARFNAAWDEAHGDDDLDAFIARKVSCSN